MSRRSSLTTRALAAVAPLLAGAGALQAQTVDAFYAGSYAVTAIGSAPGVTTSYGGLTFLAGDANTLLIGGSANQSGGKIYSIGVARDAGGHITGFSGPASLFSTAPYIDGGLAYGPGGVLFYAGYPTNQVGQIEPGSTTPDRVDNVNAISTGSLGGLGFIPAGFANAGQMALLSYGASTYRRVVLAPDGSGTYTLAAAPGSSAIGIGGGPEGIAWVPTGSALFSDPSILVTEYGANRVVSYRLDANGDPVVASRRAFVTGLTGAEGAVIDPVTGDFLFSTFGATNRVVRVSGFAAPNVVPEPATVALMGGGLALLGLAARRRRTA